MVSLQQYSDEVFGMWRALIGAGEPDEVSRGAAIYAAHDPAEHLFVLTRGQVSLHLRHDDQRTLMVRELSPGHIFGHMALVNQAHDTFASALRPSRFYRIPRATLQQMLQNDNVLAMNLLNELGAYRAAISNTLDEIGFMNVSARLASVLLRLAEQYDASQMLELPRRSHRQLAEMINAYRETVTKTINEFREQKLLEINRATIRLLNRAGLEERAENW